MDLDKIRNLIGSLNKEHFINRLPDRLDCFKHGLSKMTYYLWKLMLHQYLRNLFISTKLTWKAVIR